MMIDVAGCLWWLYVEGVGVVFCVCGLFLLFVVVVGVVVCGG